MIIIIAYVLSFLLINAISPKICHSVESQKRFESISCFILIFGFFGFRGLSVLNDTAHYYEDQLILTRYGDFYNSSIFNVDPTLNFEIGFQVLQRFIGKYISSDPYALILISALILTIGTIWYLNKNTNKISVCIFFMLATFILFNQFCVTRQSYAALCFYLSCIFYENRKYILSLAIIYFATFFHTSAVVLLLPYVMSFFNINKRNITITILCGTIITIFLFPILKSLNIDTYSIYVTTALERESIALASILTTLLMGLLLGICLYIDTHYKISQRPHKILIWSSITGLFFSAGSILVQAFARFSVYFTPAIILVFIHYLYLLPSRQHKTIYTLCVLILMLHLIIVLEYRNEWFHLIPYNFHNFNEIAPNYEFGY